MQFTLARDQTSLRRDPTPDALLKKKQKQKQKQTQEQTNKLVV